MAHIHGKATMDVLPFYAHCRSAAQNNAWYPPESEPSESYFPHVIFSARYISPHVIFISADTRFLARAGWLGFPHVVFPARYISARSTYFGRPSIPGAGRLARISARYVSRTLYFPHVMFASGL